ncbi:MAG: hypothetical protein ABIM98_09120 [candidate division WOR-3 bacterium]
MRTEIYTALNKILKKYKNQVGKILQCLLGLSLYKILECPPECININLVEGVDIVVEYENLKYAIEVKTTTGGQINIEGKDFEGLKRYRENGYIPLITILHIDLHSEWLFVNPERVERKFTWNIKELYTDQIYKNLSEKVNRAFEELVSKHVQKIQDNGLKYLLKILKEEKIRYSGK